MAGYIGERLRQRIKRALVKSESDRPLPALTGQPRPLNLQFVRPTDEAIDGIYPAVVEWYDSDEREWVEEDGECFVASEADDALDTGRRYLSIEFGDIEIEDAQDPKIRTLFIAAVGGAGASVKIVRVAHTPITVGNIRYYPSRFASFNASGNSWNWGSGDYDCFLVQAHDHPGSPYDLDVPDEGDGGSIVTAHADGESKTLTVDDAEKTLPVYLTTEYPALRVNCVPGNIHPHLP